MDILLLFVMVIGLMLIGVPIAVSCMTVRPFVSFGPDCGAETGRGQSAIRPYAFCIAP